MWAADYPGSEVWAILQLCSIIIDFSTACCSDASLGHFPGISPRDESCAITLRRFAENDAAVFQSLHPCALQSTRACILPCPSQTAAQGPKHPMPRMPIPHAGMHWLRDEGFQGLWADARERRAQPKCPLCRQPVNFGRAYRRGSERGANG